MTDSLLNNAVGAALRRDAATAGSCLVAINGHSQDEDRRRSREAGFDLHLTMPVDMISLERRLAELSTGR